MNNSKQNPSSNKMPLDVYAKLVTNECKQLRIDNQELRETIEAQSQKINELKKQLQDYKESHEKKIKKYMDDNFQFDKELRESDMYKNIQTQNKNLRRENKRLREINGGLIAKLNKYENG